MQVQRAFAEIRRSDFLTDDQRRYSAEDRPLPIGHGQTNSQPTTVLRMLEWLDVRQADSVLDVGSGSGWTTALLGHLTGPTGRVRGVERVPELVVWGGENVASYDLPWVSIQPAESEVLGLPGEAPFDRILVSAQARHLPEELVGQLAEPGRMVIPVFGRMLVVDRSATGQVSARRLGHYAFVPLR